MAPVLIPSIIIGLMLISTNAWDSRQNFSETRNYSDVRHANTNYTNILNFWTEQKNKLVFNDEFKEVVLVMGNTGSGKTTLVSALTGQKLWVIKPNGYPIIVDKEDRIGKGTSSKTLIPEAIKDYNKNVTYIDCSGFRDNRNIEYKISSLYFQKILMNQVEKIKLLLVINYESLKFNGNKNDFDDLFEHIREFSKNISKFHDGIALVATKVENNYEESDVGMVLTNTNHLVIKGIADYLEHKKEIYRLKTENLEKYKMFVNLIDILLQRKNDSYSRIAIFRQPTGKGLLENLKRTKNEINAIAEMTDKNLHYVDKKEDDFGFALSKASKLIIDQIVDDIFRNALSSRLGQITNETLTHFLQIEKQYGDIKILRDQLTQAYDVISEITKVDGPLALFKKFLNAANTLNISVSITNLNTISDDIKALKFFTTVSNTNGDIHMLLLINETQHVIKSVKYLRYFYDFLNNLQADLAAYKSQPLKNNNCIANIMTSCASSTDRVVQDITDLENIVEKIGNIVMYREIKTIKLNQFQLAHMKAVFEAFSSKLELSCSSSSKEMTVKGYNVRMSDVVNKDCWAQAKNIQIFAINKVFIDCTIDKTGAEVNLFILAPTWEVIDTPKIILDGKSGETHHNASANSAEFKTENGKSGQPGFPGGPAGIFFGVGKQFVNSEHLEIHARGGKGGPGQQGGNGADGIAGLGLPESFFKIEQDPDDLILYLQEHNYDFSWKYLGKSGFSSRSPEKYKADVYGKPATKPTDGGDGGAGGRGGYPGKIVIISLGHPVHITTFNNAGTTGSEGQAGYGGKETSDGRRVKFDYRCMGVFGHHHGEYSNIIRIDGAKVPAGKDGNPGRNKNNERSPKKTTMTRPYLAINAFKGLMRNNLNKNINESALRSLINELESDNNIKAQYDTLAFVKELEELEDQFLELRNQIDFVPFYNSLLTRIEEFAISQKNNKDKKVLSYVYTAALTKVITLKKKRKGKTVVDLYQYLNNIEINVKKIQDVQHLQTILDYENDYEDTLRGKIWEASDFIENKIEVEMNKLWEESDRQIMGIINEIQEEKNATENKLTSAEKERRKIRDMMYLRSMLTPLKLAASSLSFFGPVGAMAGVAVTSSATIAEGMLLDTTSGQGSNRMYSLDPNLNLMSRVTEVVNNKPQQLAEKLSDVIEKLDKNKEELADTQKEKIEISQKIGYLKSQVDEVKNTKASTISDIERREKQAKGIEKELNDFISSRKDILEKEKTKLDAMSPEKENEEKLRKEIKLEKTLRRINHAQSILNIGGTVFNIIKKFENDEGMMRNINKQISEHLDEFKKLEKLEDQVYSVVLPDFRQMEKTVNAIKKSLNGSTHAKLDLTKWTVRNTLRDVKSLLQKFTHKMSFELQSNLKRYMEKIDEGFSILIDIYNRIDSYSDSVKQAQYIAHIVSTPMTNVKITDSELNKAVLNLNLIIQSNLLFEKYGMALHAFKQHYFPFAADVLKTFQLPTGMRLNDTETLRTKIIETILDMKSHIAERQATIGEYSKFTHKNSIFNSYTYGSKPFYVWKYDTIKYEVQRLLNGSEILIKADISKGLNYNSVKYTDIGINFKLKNENLQKNFTTVLKNFALTMTMVGNNYYRCAERYYFISVDDDITISYTLNQDEAKNWINPNEVYDIIRSSNPFLSPYGLWSVKLKNFNDSVSFEILNFFVNQTIDLELTGRGYYIEQDSVFNFDVCNEDLDEFYNVEVITTELG